MSKRSTVVTLNAQRCTLHIFLLLDASIFPTSTAWQRMKTKRCSMTSTNLVYMVNPWYTVLDQLEIFNRESLFNVETRESNKTASYRLIWHSLKHSGNLGVILESENEGMWYWDHEGNLRIWIFQIGDDRFLPMAPIGNPIDISIGFMKFQIPKFLSRNLKLSDDLFWDRAIIDFFLGIFTKSLLV